MKLGGNFQKKKIFNFRFDPEVIEQRKKNILDFLYYCAENPVIYRSQYFVKFFEHASPEESPLHGPENSGDIVKQISHDSPNESLDEESIVSVETHVEAENNDTTVEKLSQDVDYLYCAALLFSRGVQEEVNSRYKEAFDSYKSGIDKLLTGAKNDTNERRKRIAKTKAQKYLEKAEQLYENHILRQQETDFFIEDANADEIQSIASLERPINNMSKYKVIQVNNRIMHVQDCTDKKIYIIKSIWKSHTNRVIFMPQKIPFMIPLLSYFATENVIFLLLPFISGGLLWNYVKNYEIDKVEHHQIEELFVEPPKEKNNKQILSEECPIEINGRVAKDITQNIEIQEAIEAIDEIDGCQYLMEKFNEPIVPSFDTFPSNPDKIDIDDLMKNSQKLLQSVTKTLEKSVILSSEINDDNLLRENIDEIQSEQEEENAAFIESFPEEASIPQNIELEELSSLPERMVKQWAAELIIAVNSLHKNGIILGDLNLDNILLGHNGHIVLTYFHQKDRSNIQQLCNLNPNAVKCCYVAFDFPITKSSDYYSIGVIIYEILTRNRFYRNHPGGVFKFNEVQYPASSVISDEAKKILDNLILGKPDERMTFEDLKQHKFFDGVDFDEIEKNGF